MRAFIIGLGHAGRNLHLRALRGIPELCGGVEPLGYDPLPRPVAGVRPVGSPREALRHTDPRETVVHLCTPPAVRVEPVSELAALGFRTFLVEKPLAPTGEQARELLALARRHGLRVTVVAPWLSSAVTQRIRDIAASGELGAVRRIAFRQTKPRLAHTATSTAHADAFEVEPPHSVGVALALAGDAEPVAAWLRDTPPVDGRVFPGMGGAGLTLAHHGGAVTEIVSDLTDPLRTRRIEVDFERGRVTGHYSPSADDLTGRVEIGGTVETFPDDALRTLFTRVYTRPDHDDPADLESQCRVVELLEAARALARSAVDEGGHRAAR
ncbi:Gfo/Idh/MocA family protein [Nocardia sp. NPDC004068]|uniref:Gfo/Idh/MocA family protein n=1 Tax=Nocardia sp. NPDC004068 TaxID=3364303 RepID=UPI0036BDD739